MKVSEMSRTGEGAKLYEERFGDGTSDKMVQSNGGNDEDKSDNYDTQKMFQNPYLLRVSHRFWG